GGGYGVSVAAQALDGLRGDASLPKADEPQSVQAAAGEQGQLFVGNLVESVNVALIFFRKLLEPDIGALGDEHDGGHPCLVGAEGLVLVHARARRTALPITNELVTHEAV